MTAVIFFAKARDREFERYEKGIRSNGVVFQKTSPMLRVWSNLQTLGGGYTVGGTLDEFLVRILSVDLKDNDGKDAGCLFVVEKPEGRDFTCGFVDAICNTKSQSFDKKIVFAHTGDSTILDAEARLDKAFHNGVECHALSSTDTSRLDVTASEIPVPTTLTEVEELKKRCRNASEKTIDALDVQETLANLPFIVCTNREALKAEGVTAPYEFIIETERGETVADRKNLFNACGKNLDLQSFKEPLKDWFAGLFRKYLLLDTTAHGHEGFVEADKSDDDILQESVKKDARNKEAKLLRHRFLNEPITDDESIQETDPLEGYKKLLETIYKAYFADVQSPLFSVKSAIMKSNLKALVSLYTDRDLDRFGDVALSHANRLPRAYGDRAKYVTPTGKLNLLLIDDKVDESPLAHLGENYNEEKYGKTICEDDWKLLSEIFNVEKLQIDSRYEIADKIRDRLATRAAHALSYDLILVDLCLGEGGDLSGYNAIQLIHMYRPGVPVVVYSRFRDMEHITRALNEGAKWFLVKGEEAKLPRHVLKLLKQPGWHKEWNSLDLRPQFTCDDGVFLKKFLDKPEWQYLTYKVLNRFPGTEIHIKKMGGGISNATTFRAEKGEKDENGRFLQTPHIVKIDNEHAMRTEYERYTRFIRPYMANESGRVEQPERVINRESAAIVYTFAGKQDDAHVLASMGSMLKDDLMSRSVCDFEKYRDALDWIFDDILPKIHKVKLNDEHTSYPNALFGEVPQENWLANYRARMMPCGRVEISQDFVCQNSSDAKFHWEFHDTARDPKDANKYCLEVYDENKNVFLFAGERCDFIAKFRRRLMPGVSLWLENSPFPQGPKPRSDYWASWLKAMLENNGHKEPAFCAAVTALSMGWPFPVVSPTKPLSSCCAKLQDKLLRLAYKHGFDDNEKAKLTRIVHGDLNLNNIMLEARKHAPKDADRDITKTINDVWFIDFARTRRDIVAHDFNVFFTSTLGFLFDKDILKRYAGLSDPKSGRSYFEKIASVFPVFIREAVASKTKDLKSVPDEIADDPRLVLVYRILRRSREAALKYMSEKTYVLTTALACLGAMKIFIKKKDCLEMAAAYFAAAKICCDCYCMEVAE